MNSLILRTTTRLITPLLLVFSFFLLLRGHNEPGGGFIGGLVAAIAFALYALAFGVQTARQILAFDPRTVIACGLLAAVAAGVVAVRSDLPFFTGIWAQQDLPIIGPLNSPLLFDIGVYLVVTGFTLHILFTLAEE